MAFAALGALVAAETVTATMVLGAMAEVGTAMTVVGAVTGNKDLMKLGGVVGLVGGVGGLMSSAATGAAGAAAGEAAGAAAGGNAMDAMEWTAGQAGNTAQSAAGNIAGGGNAMDAAEFSNTAVQAPSATQVDASFGTNVTSQPATEAAAQQTSTSVAAPTAPTGPASVQDVGAKYATDYANGGPSQGLTGAEKGSNFFGSAWDFIKNPANKELVNTGAKVIGGVFQGMQQADEFDRKQGLEEGKFSYQQARDANVRQQNKSRVGIIQRVQA